jgi:hypothetical protein
MTQDWPVVTISFHIMRKAGQGRVLHAVPASGKRWGKALCGQKTGTRWEPGPWDSVVTCADCRRKLGVSGDAGEIAKSPEK